MPDRLFIGRFEMVDVQHLARTGGLGKARQQSLFRRKRHVLALAPADRFRLERLDPAAVIGHVRAVHGAQRNAHRLRDRGLRHSALAQQHHLDALALRRRDFPSQRCFQLPDLLLGALDHPSPRIRQPKRIISRALMRDRKTPKIPRFKQLWKRYDKGIGVPQDYAAAMSWYRKAADQGLAKAQFNLGSMYYDGLGVPQDFAAAVSWYGKAADQGLATAQFNLGSMYYHGLGVPQDFAAAASWYRKAADQGLAKAQFNIGIMYVKGEGVPKDHVSAYMWFN